MTNTVKNPHRYDVSPSKGACSIERIPKTVIESRLLAALDDKSKVAMLLDKQDCEDLHAALCGYVLGDWQGDVLSWEAHLARRKELAEGLAQLMKEAFPK